MNVSPISIGRILHRALAAPELLEALLVISAAVRGAGCCRP
jgi:hypothetical protein